jgi:hypothetical protein
MDQKMQDGGASILDCSVPSADTKPVIESPRVCQKQSQGHLHSALSLDKPTCSHLFRPMGTLRPGRALFEV